MREIKKVSWEEAKKVLEKHYGCKDIKVMIHNPGEVDSEHYKDPDYLEGEIVSQNKFDRTSTWHACIFCGCISDSTFTKSSSCPACGEGFIK